MAHETTDGTDNALLFTGLLDGHFNAGEPHRHRPGDQVGEEEVHLEPSPEVSDFLLGLVPDEPEVVLDMLVAVRPKLDNIRPLRIRADHELVGHRLEIRQLLGNDDSRVVSTAYYLNTAGELRCGAPPKLHRRTSAAEDFQTARHFLPVGRRGLAHVFYADLGVRSRFKRTHELSEEEASELFRFIGGCTVREPRVT